MANQHCFIMNRSCVSDAMTPNLLAEWDGDSKKFVCPACCFFRKGVKDVSSYDFIGSLNR